MMTSCFWNRQYFSSACPCGFLSRDHCYLVGYCYFRRHWQRQSPSSNQTSRQALVAPLLSFAALGGSRKMFLVAAVYDWFGDPSLWQRFFSGINYITHSFP